MTTRLLQLTLALLVLGGSAACNREEPTPSSQAPGTPAEQTKGAAAQQPTDDASITTSVQAKYYADDTVRGDEISVTTDGGIVTLQGNVDSEDEKTRAVALAREVPGVTRVEDQLRVAAPGSDTTAARRDPSAGRPTDVAGTSEMPQTGSLAGSRRRSRPSTS